MDNVIKSYINNYNNFIFEIENSRRYINFFDLADSDLGDYLKINLNLSIEEKINRGRKFNYIINQYDLSDAFLDKQTKLFSHKSSNNKILSNILFDNIPLRNLLTKQTDTYKDILWNYILNIYISIEFMKQHIEPDSVINKVILAKAMRLVNNKKPDSLLNSLSSSPESDIKDNDNNYKFDLDFNSLVNNIIHPCEKISGIAEDPIPVETRIPNEDEDPDEDPNEDEDPDEDPNEDEEPNEDEDLEPDRVCDATDTNIPLLDIKTEVKNKINSLFDTCENNTTQNIINDIIDDFDSFVDVDPTKNFDMSSIIKKLSQKITTKYKSDIETNGIDLKNVLSNITTKIPELKKIIPDSFLSTEEKKVDIEIDENFSTSDIVCTEEPKDKDKSKNDNIKMSELLKLVDEMGLMPPGANKKNFSSKKLNKLTKNSSGLNNLLKKLDISKITNSLNNC